jgi:hypothetical protein
MTKLVIVLPATDTLLAFQFDQTIDNKKNDWLAKKERWVHKNSLD